MEKKNTEKNSTAENLGKIITRNLGNLEKTRQKQAKRKAVENKVLREEISRLKKELKNKPEKIVLPTSKNKSQLDKIITETATRAVLNIKKEYDSKKNSLENELARMMETLKKEKQAFLEEKKSLEKERNEFKNSMEEQKTEIMRTGKALAEKIRTEEHSRLEKLLEEKEQSLIKQETEYLENLIRSLETEI